MDAFCSDLAEDMEERWRAHCEAYLVHGSHLHLDGIHGRNEVLHCLSHQPRCVGRAPLAANAQGRNINVRRHLASFQDAELVTAGAQLSE